MTGPSRFLSKAIAWFNAVRVSRTYVKNRLSLIFLTVLRKRGTFKAKAGGLMEKADAKLLLRFLVRINDRIKRMGFDPSNFPISFSGRFVEISVLGGRYKLKIDPLKLNSITSLPEQIQEVYDIDVNGLTVLDVGAYVGDSVLLWLSRGARQVVAVEPVPEHFEALVETTKGLPVTCINAAVGEPVPEMPTGFKGSGSYGLRHRGLAEGWLNVPVLSLLELVEKYRPQVVKLNCEGCEHFVLDELVRLPSLGVKKLVVQFHDRGDNLRKEESYEYLIKYLGEGNILQRSAELITVRWDFA